MLDVEKTKKRYFLGIVSDIEKDINLIIKMLDRIKNDVDFIDTVIEEELGKED